MISVLEKDYLRIRTHLVQLVPACYENTLSRMHVHLKTVMLAPRKLLRLTWMIIPPTRNHT